MRLLLCFILVTFSMRAHANGPLLKPNDVIALVGGEDMVIASELGYVEALVQRALPDHRLKFRSLAWEGDTVFEQRRDLNYPTLEAQLEKMGATVVVLLFGQMESVGGERALPEFLSAYEKLIARLQGTSGRRVVIVRPPAWSAPKSPLLIPMFQRGVQKYAGAVEEFGKRKGLRVIEVDDSLDSPLPSRDGVHAESEYHGFIGSAMAWGILGEFPGNEFGRREYAASESGAVPTTDLGKLREAVIAKNRLWFHYSRPQNWAFLAGDRTNQPSSRDYIDRNKRWFPEELEKFVPLIEAKEKEIWELAAKLKH